MAFSMFSGQISPIAINFGSASVKLLQLSRGEKPAMVAAAEIAIPETMRQDQDRLFLMLQQELPKAIKAGKFKGKRVVTTVPSATTFIQHMQVATTEGVKTEDLVLAELQAKLGVAPRSVVVRTIEVADVARHGQSRTEMICFAVSRDIVMRYIELLKRQRMEVVGVHTEIVAMVRAFDHINRRESDKNVTTLYVDIGWGGTRVAITHGKQIVFARYIQVGGRHFDQLVANTLHCDLPTARAHRLALEKRSLRSSVKRSAQRDSTALLRTANALAEAAAEHTTETQTESGGVVTTEPERRVGQRPIELACSVQPATMSIENSKVDMSELLDTVTDELSMSLRYHRGLFPGRPVDRVVFLGGEARQLWLCQHVVKELGLPAQLGDPLARYRADQSIETPGVDVNEPQPGWAVPCGLCMAPTDL